EIVEADAGQDRLAVAAGADQRPHRGSPDVDDGGGLHARHDGGHGQRELHEAQLRARRQPQRARRLAQRLRGPPPAPARVAPASKPYRNSATSAGGAPIPNSGISSTSSASDGIVCSTPATPTSTRPRRGRRDASTPSGTASAIAASSDVPTRSRCSAVRRPSA